MADLTTQATSAVAAGVSSVFVAVLGIEPGPLLWAAIGAFVGMSFAPTAGRLRAALMFLAVSLSCAELGTWAAIRWFESAPIAVRGSALLLGFFFHPLLAALVSKMPQIVGVLTRTEKQ